MTFLMISVNSHSLPTIQNGSELTGSQLTNTGLFPFGGFCVIENLSPLSFMQEKVTFVIYNALVHLQVSALVNWNWLPTDGWR